MKFDKRTIIVLVSLALVTAGVLEFRHQMDVADKELAYMEAEARLSQAEARLDRAMELLR